MISLIEQLPAGNALRVFLQPPDGAVRWKLLRARTSTIPAHDWSGGTLVLSSSSERAALDADGLVNGETVFYRAFYQRRDGVWLPSSVVPGMAQTTFADESCDALTLVRDRLELGLAALMARGDIAHDDGAIPVLTASPEFEGVNFPLVTVHLASDVSASRFIGDVVSGDELTDVGWAEFHGWLSRVQLTVIGWALNSDERLDLRRALKSLLLVNQPVFAAAGMQEMDLQFSDQEDFESYGAPVFQTVCSLSCVAPSFVRSVVPAVRDVTSTAIEP